MIDFLERVLNAQLVVSLLGMVIPSLMRWGGLIPAELWQAAFVTSVVTFVGGNFIKEALTAFANRSPA